MSRFTKEQRQQILDDFARRHNGQFDPKLFLQEVHDIGSTHPAYLWFEWDEAKAAYEYRLWQARTFARDLRITFSIEEVGRQGAITVRTVSMPMVISPVADRDAGGGYVVSAPDNQDHMVEHCLQAAIALRAWLRRYQAALAHAGCKVAPIAKTAEMLEACSPQSEAA